MLTDSYGGICPNCGYDRTMVRYGSLGYFQFDACPNCWFAYGHNNHDPEAFDWAVFECILDEMKQTLEENGFPVTVPGLMLYLETLPGIQEIESVFDYTNFDWGKYEW